MVIVIGLWVVKRVRDIRRLFRVSFRGLVFWGVWWTIGLRVKFLRRNF